MGLCIHFHGTLRTFASLPRLREVLLRHTNAAEAELIDIDDEVGELGRYLNDDLMDTSAPLKGFLLRFQPACEPVFFVFGKDRRMACSCKTQFTTLDNHKRIVHLLEEVAPLFEELQVSDEGGYWETHDEAELLARRNKLAQAIDMVAEALKHGKPHARPTSDHDLN